MFNLWLKPFKQINKSAFVSHFLTRIIRKIIKIIGVKWINFEISTLIAFIHKNLKNSSFNLYFHLIVKI